MTLFVDVEEYIGLLSPNAGARVALHEPGVTPFMKTESMAVATGEATFLAISKQQISRMGGKYGKCAKEWPKELKLKESITKSNYSTERCLKYCMLNYLLTECGCIDSYDFRFTTDEVLLEKLENGTFQQCSPTDKDTRNCRNDVYLKFANDTFNCPCKVPCDTHDFLSKTSRSEWPSPSYSSYLVSQLVKAKIPRVQAYLTRLSTSNDKPKRTRIHESIQKNFVRLEIFYQTSTCQVVQEAATYGHMDLLSEFGGSISLWLGWSIFALLELLVFLLHCLEALIIKYRNN